MTVRIMGSIANTSETASVPSGLAIACNPLDERDAVALAAFPCLLDIGEALLRCGADVHFVEEEIVSTGLAYGASKMNVFVITSSIVATMTLPQGYERTLTRRVSGTQSINFDKLERISSLCREAARENMAPLELKKRLVELSRTPMPAQALFLGGILSAGAFTMFFGGSLLDAFVSAAFAVVICLLLRYVHPWTPSIIVFNFVVSFLCGLGIMGVSNSFGQVSPDMVMSGDIMLLIPGVAMTNATRDMFSGDTVSGIMKLVESLLWAVALALGFMAAIWLAGEIW